MMDRLEPVAWHCKDYADGWINFESEAEALAYQEDTGCLLRVIYRPRKEHAATAIGNRRA